jgi:hypothetical protein
VVTSVRPGSKRGRYPLAVPGWQELRLDLTRIRQDQPGALRGYPDPSSPIREGPVSIELAAWAEDLAAGLHATYGDYVTITVGAFGYPSLTARPRLLPTLPEVTATTFHLTVTPVETLRVKSGDHATAELDIGNQGHEPRELHTTGHLTAYVVDEQQQVVGGYVGAVHLPLVRFGIDAKSTTRVPVLLGAASLRPDLGYAVPPGAWQVLIELPTANGTVVSPVLPLTIT